MAISQIMAVSMPPSYRKLPLRNPGDLDGLQPDSVKTAPGARPPGHALARRRGACNSPARA
jgi:hypothetical protein